MSEGIPATVDEAVARVSRLDQRYQAWCALAAAEAVYPICEETLKGTLFGDKLALVSKTLSAAYQFLDGRLSRQAFSRLDGGVMELFSDVSCYQADVLAASSNKSLQAVLENEAPSPDPFPRRVMAGAKALGAASAAVASTKFDGWTSRALEYAADAVRQYHGADAVPGYLARWWDDCQLRLEFADYEKA